MNGRKPWPVLLMVRELNLGGTERQLSETAKALDRSLFEPHAGCFRADGLRAAELRAAGIPVAQFPVHSFASPSVFRGARELNRYVTRNGIRLVHTFDAPATIFGVPAARAAGVLTVLSSQRAYRDLVSRPQRHLLRITDQLVDGIVVNCRAIERHLMEDERVPPAAIHLCYNGIDTQVFQPLDRSRRPELVDAGVTIGAVCALRPEKDLNTLLDAFALMRPHHGLTTARLVIVGDGPLRQDLQDRANNLALGPDCIFVPATKDVAGWLRSIDIFVQCSLTEALSNSLMEAMACGCCPIASRVGGNPELVTDGYTGLLFTPGNAEELAARLSLAVSDCDLGNRLAERACKLVQEVFPLQAAARCMAGIYLDQLESRTP